MNKLSVCLTVVAAMQLGVAVGAFNTVEETACRDRSANVPMSARSVSKVAAGDSPLSAIDYPGHDAGRDIYGNAVR